MATQPKEQEYVYQVDQQVSINAFLDVPIDAELVRFQVTSRYGSTAEKIVKTTEAVIDAYKQLRAAHPLPERKTVEAPRPAEQAATSEAKKGYEHKPVASVPDGLPDGEYFSDEFDYFVVEPQPDNKVTVKFYKDSLKFPVGASINKWKHASAKTALDVLVADFDPARAEKYRVAGVQFWTKGNEYTKQDGTKSNYKDFRAAQATF
jgi:hypothetical protein